MSAVAVIFERGDKQTDLDVFNRVMERLSHRGPHGRDVVSAPKLLLGHWHFWTTPDEVGERQPLKLEGLPFTILLDGRIDNREYIFSQLGIGREQAQSLSDAALVLHAYSRWGENCFEHFLGEFALVIFDELRHELICARDHLGGRTLFYASAGTHFVIASEAWAAAGIDQGRPSLNERAAAHYFALQAPLDGQTLFNGVSELLPAHVMVVNASSQRLRRYWEPDPHKKIRYKTDREYAEQFRLLLEDSVRSRLRSATPVGVLMSGGLDSGSVACLAAAMLKPHQLTTISYVFDELLDCDERECIAAIQSQWGIRSIQIPCDDAWPFKDWSNWPNNPSQPEPNMYRLLKERAYARAHGEGLRVLFTGAFGDELYSGAEDWLADLILDGKFFHAGRELIRHLRYASPRWNWEAGYLQRAVRRFLAFGFRDFFRDHQRHVPPWLTGFSAASLPKNAPELHPAFELWDDVLGLRAAWDASCEIYHASRHGIELRNPYRDRRLVEYVLSIPAYQLYNRGYYKYILRMAMEGTLPNLIRTTNKRSSLLPLFNRGIQREGLALRGFFEKRGVGWAKFVSPDWVPGRWKAEVHAQDGGPQSLVPWLCFSFESWYNPTV